MKRALEPGTDPNMLVAPADMLIVRTNGSRDLIGRAAVALDELPESSSFASYLIRFRLIALGALPSWIGQFWQSAFIRNLIESHAASSAGQYNVSLGELAGCLVPLAPLDEQNVILARLNETLGASKRTLAVVSGQLDTCAALERALLAKAFRGELVAQDSADEPADVMLGRLRNNSVAPVAEHSNPKTHKQARSGTVAARRRRA